MEKNNLAWVVVRAFGVYFAAQVLLHLYNLGTFIYALSKLYKISALKNEMEYEIIRTWVDIGIIGVEFLILIFLTYYCLRKGAFIHKLLMFGGSSEKT